MWIGIPWNRSLTLCGSSLAADWLYPQAGQTPPIDVQRIPKNISGVTFNIRKKVLDLLCAYSDA